MAEIRGAECRTDGKPRAGWGQGRGAMEKRAKVCGGVPPSQPHPQESCAKINQAEAGSANLGSLTLSSLPLFGQFGT